MQEILVNGIHKDFYTASLSEKVRNFVYGNYLYNHLIVCYFTKFIVTKNGYIINSEST